MNRIFRKTVIIIAILVSASSLNAQSFTKTFPEIGFSITSPCQLLDISKQAEGEFYINYGGVSNENDRDKIAFYQVIVSRLPIGYKNISSTQLSTMVDEQLKNMMSNFNNVKSIRFSYKEYKGYVGDTSHNGYKQKGLVFHKDNYIICLTLLTNYYLGERFNLFNRFRFELLIIKFCTHIKLCL